MQSAAGAAIVSHKGFICRACVRIGRVMDCYYKLPAPMENKHHVSTPHSPTLPLVQFQHLQLMLSETDPQLADVVRKQFPDWDTQQISVQHSSRLPLLLFIVDYYFLSKVCSKSDYLHFHRNNSDVTQSLLWTTYGYSL